MNNCKTIEPLLYLYRDNELSEDERKMVLEHCETCSGCRDILDQLQLVDENLKNVREDVRDLAGKRVMVSATMDRIARTNARSDRHPASDFIDGLLGWLRPSFAILLIFAAMVLVVQISRDAFKVQNLERRLAAKGDFVGSAYDAGRTTRPDPLKLLNLLESNLSPLSSRLRGASASQEVKEAFSPALNSGLFSDLAKHYPNLSRISLEKGLNEHDRLILDTEGKAFIKEFELLLRKGEDRL